jgi:hypothetical protein
VQKETLGLVCLRGLQNSPFGIIPLIFQTFFYHRCYTVDLKTLRRCYIKHLSLIVCKGKFCPRTASEGPEGNSSILSLTSALDVGGGLRHAPAALSSRKRPGTHFTGGWVGRRAGLEGCGKSCPTGIRSPDSPAHSESLSRLSRLLPYSPIISLSVRTVVVNLRRLSTYSGSWT